MSVASISSLGVGSTLDLQNILDQLRGVDEAPITAQEVKKTEVEERLAEFDVVKAKLLTMKSHALTLSLQSNFLEREVSVSDEDVLTATVLTGTAATSNSLNVERLATRSSWKTAGVASASTSVYVPTIQESTTGFATTATPVITADETMTITYGSGGTQETIEVTLTENMTLSQVKDAINNEDTDDYVTAETFQDDGKYYLRIKATSGGSSEAERVMVTVAPTDLSFAAPDVSFTLTNESGTTTISVAADTTFTGLAALINDDEDNPGITAAVIDDGTDTDPYRLVLTADATGEDSRISISGLALTEVQGKDSASLNAEIWINGIIYERQTNTGINDIIQGVTLNFGEEGTATVNVTADTDFIKTEVTGLVESLNDLIQEITANSAYDEDTGEWGILAASTSVRGLTDKLLLLTGSVVNTGGSITSIYDLGMEVNRDGTITLDEDVLTQAISSYTDDVIDLFLGDDDADVTGLGDILNDALRDMTRLSGLINSEKNAAQDDIDRMEDDIEDATERLDMRYESLTRRFIELDIYMSQMQSTGNYLSEIFAAFDVNK